MKPHRKGSTRISDTHILVHQAKLGSSRAFDEIYEMYRSKVFGVCLRITRSRADSEDLTQEVFIQARRKLEIFRGDSAFGTWLYKIAFNRALMFLRSRCIEEPSSDLAQLERTSMSASFPPPFYGYEPIRYLALKRAIASLPAGRRSVVILHDLNGLTHREVGSRLGIAASTSKAQLHHAHVALRSFLGVEHHLKARLSGDKSLSRAQATNNVQPLRPFES